MDNIQYTTTEPMRWDALAYKAYGDENKSEKLIAANPRIPVTDIIPSGTVLEIPLIEESIAAMDAELLPPWKR